MTSETTSPFTTSPEQQFMLDVTRKKIYVFLFSTSSGPTLRHIICYLLQGCPYAWHGRNRTNYLLYPWRNLRVHYDGWYGAEDFGEHSIPLSTSVRERIYVSWKSSVIVKVVGSSHTTYLPTSFSGSNLSGSPKTSGHKKSTQLTTKGPRQTFHVHDNKLVITHLSNQHQIVAVNIIPCLGRVVLPP